MAAAVAGQSTEKAWFCQSRDGICASANTVLHGEMEPTSRALTEQHMACKPEVMVWNYAKHTAGIV